MKRSISNNISIEVISSSRVAEAKRICAHANAGKSNYKGSFGESFLKRIPILGDLLVG